MILDWIPSPISGSGPAHAGQDRQRSRACHQHRTLCAEQRFFRRTRIRAVKNSWFLDGVFQDEHGDFPAGSYVRNPPTSSHTPGSDAGCTIFVKLWQFDPADRTYIRKHTDTTAFAPSAGEPGVELLPLHRDESEDVRMERWAPGAEVTRSMPGGLELLILEGSLTEAGQTLDRNTWLRLPKKSEFTAKAGPGGVRFWIKTGHLAETPQPPATG